MTRLPDCPQSDNAQCSSSLSSAKCQLHMMKSRCEANWAQGAKWWMVDSVETHLRSCDAEWQSWQTVADESPLDRHGKRSNQDVGTRFRSGTLKQGGTQFVPPGLHRFSPPARRELSARTRARWQAPQRKTLSSHSSASSVPLRAWLIVFSWSLGVLSERRSDTLPAATTPCQ